MGVFFPNKKNGVEKKIGTYPEIANGGADQLPMAWKTGGSLEKGIQRAVDLTFMVNPTT